MERWCLGNVGLDLNGKGMCFVLSPLVNDNKSNEIIYILY